MEEIPFSKTTRPVFPDIRPDTLNMDETLVEAACTSRTRAIGAVHYVLSE